MSAAIIDSTSRMDALSEIWSASEATGSKSEYREGGPVVGPYRSEEQFDVEVEYSRSFFPIEDGVAVHLSDPVNNPITLRYKDEEGVLEVKGWGLQVPIQDSERLPWEIGRRFLQLYSHAIARTLSEDDRQCLERVSAQVDSHRFSASRLRPRRLDAFLVRKEPVVLIQFLDEHNEKLAPRVARSLEVLKPGDRFSADFTLDGDGSVRAVERIQLLPSEPQAWSAAELEAADKAKPIAFPEHLRGRLPQPPTSRDS